jgi:hypothetical protein
METIDKVQEEEIVEEDLATLPDDTDWKAKAEELERKRREDGIRNRERTKNLRTRISELEKPPEKKEPEKKEKNTETEALLGKLERMALRSAGITHQDDIELARRTAEKWKMDIDDVLLDDDFKVKLEKQQTVRANIEATSNIRGGSGTPSSTKNTPEYWLSKGKVPTPEEVGDRKTRAKIMRAFIARNSSSGKTFYND